MSKNVINKIDDIVIDSISDTIEKSLNLVNMSAVEISAEQLTQIANVRRDLLTIIVDLIEQNFNTINN